MSDLTESQRKNILAKVLVTFDTAYGKGLGDSPEKVRQWYGQIAHLNEAAALAAADACVAHYKWQPSISEYLEISRSVRKQQEEMARPAPRRLEDHIAELQDKGLSVQRGLLKLRAEAGLKHDHRGGWEKCPVCSQATCENDAEECRTCMTLGANGFPEKHHA